jgi:hypothetical protein
MLKTLLMLEKLFAVEIAEHVEAIGAARAWDGP